MKVIDVSEFQGKIDFKKVKSDGVEGVIIRAGYGKGNADEYFVRNINGAIKAGLHIGIYWFSYAYTAEMARREARYCNDLIQTYKLNIDMPVFFDWEYDSMRYAETEGATVTKRLITIMTKAFCEEIENLGYEAGYYLNWDYANNYYDESKLKKYKRWFADYEDEVLDCYLQQTSSDGAVKGIVGTVDTDVLRGDLSDFKPKEGKSSTKPKKPLYEAPVQSQRYIIGDTYSVDAESGLNVRTGAGKEYSLVGFNHLTENAKQHADGSALRYGTKVTCLEVKEIDAKHVWIRIPSGWICAIDNDSKYVV